MKIKVLTFGSITDILNREFYVEALDTNSLMASLIERHNSLKERKLLIAVNNTIVQENTILNEHDVVNIMPPYSGG
jgi:molybdopterin synthase sulfur carrier subunit